MSLEHSPSTAQRDQAPMAGIEGLISRRRFTVADYHAMARAGILTEGDRVELLDGEIVRKMTINSPHAACVDRLNRLFGRQLCDRAVVRIQNPIQLDGYSEPEPDISLLRPKSDFYAEAHPMPADVLS
ncbi:MAG TPA: Uma2 family endonuclease [Acidobacteriota bacterium]